MHVCFKKGHQLHVVAIFWPLEHPAFIPGIILAIIIGLPALVSGLWEGAITLYAAIYSLETDSTESLWLVGLIFGSIFLVPLLTALSDDLEIRRYVFDRSEDRLRGFGWWFRQPLKSYEQFSTALSSISRLVLKHYRHTTPSVSVSGYTSTPKTVSWSELTGRDRQGKTRATLRLTHTDENVIQRIASYMGMEFTTEA